MREGPVRRHATTLVLMVMAMCLSACASRSSSGPDVVRGLVLPTTTSFDGGPRTPSNQPSSVRDTVIVGDRGRIWGVLPSVFASLDIDPEMIDPTTLAIGTQRQRTSRVDGNLLSVFLDCGGGVAAPNANSYDVSLSLFVQLVARGSGSTLVRTVVDATAQSRYNQSDQIQCASFGTLERRVIGLIDEGLRPSPVVTALRRPVAGDFVRLTCAIRPEDPVSVSAGEMIGVSDGALLIALAGSAQQTTVPVPNLIRLEIREQRSRARPSALVGAAAGMAAGALMGRSHYDPANASHYKPGVYATIGTVLGAVGGAALGGLVGSFLGYDTWVDGSLSFDMARSEAGSAPPAPAPSCPS
jgi:hypothetical protein